MLLNISAWLSPAADLEPMMAVKKSLLPSWCVTCLRSQLSGCLVDTSNKAPGPSSGTLNLRSELVLSQHIFGWIDCLLDHRDCKFCHASQHW